MMKMNRDIERRLRAAWRKERRVCHARGASYLVIWAVALALTDFLVDWLLHAPGWGRALLLAANLLVLGAVFFLRWWRNLRPYDPLRVALQVERKHPELGSLLVSYVQIGDETAARTGASRALVAALRRQALELTAPVDFREIVAFRELRRVAVVCAALVLGFGALNVRWHEHFRVLALRMLNLGSVQGYPTRTTILSVTGSLTVQQGRDVNVLAKAGGLIPSSARLLVRTEDGRWETIRLDPAPNGEFGRAFSAVYRSFEYRFLAGDAQTATFAVTVVPPPRVVQAAVHLRCPPYTGLGERTLSRLNLDAPTGAELAWELRFDRPIAKAEVTVEGDAAPDAVSTQKEETVAMALDASGQTARWSATAMRSFRYRFTSTDAAHPFVFPEGVTYTVQCIPDREPSVEIVSPGPSEIGTVGKTLAIEFKAADDYEVADAAVVCSLNNGPPVRVAVDLTPAREISRTTTLTVARQFPALKAGDKINYFVEVADNRDSGRAPQRSKSPECLLEIVSVEDYLAEMMRRSAESFNEIHFMRDQETDAQKAIGEMKK